VPGARDEVHAVALDAVIGIAQRVDLELAAVARTRVHHPDRETAVEELAHRGLDALADLLKRRLESLRHFLGDDADPLYLAQDAKHGAIRSLTAKTPGAPRNGRKVRTRLLDSLFLGVLGALAVQDHKSFPE